MMTKNEWREKYKEIERSLAEKENELAKCLFRRMRSTYAMSSAKKLVLLASEIVAIEAMLIQLNDDV